MEPRIKINYMIYTTITNNEIRKAFAYPTVICMLGLAKLAIRYLLWGNKLMFTVTAVAVVMQLILGLKHSRTCAVTVFLVALIGWILNIQVRHYLSGSLTTIINALMLIVVFTQWADFKRFLKEHRVPYYNLADSEVLIEGSAVRDLFPIHETTYY